LQDVCDSRIGPPKVARGEVGLLLMRSSPLHGGAGNVTVTASGSGDALLALPPLILVK